MTATLHHRESLAGVAHSDGLMPRELLHLLATEGPTMTTTCTDPDCLTCHPLDGPAVPLDIALTPEFIAGLARGAAARDREQSARRTRWGA